MSGLQILARRLVDDLRNRGTRFAVIGGFAVSVRAEPRFTRDIDLAVSVASDFEAEELTRDLQRAGYQVFSVLEQEAKKRLATLRLRFPSDAPVPLVVDLLFASSGIEPELVAAATEEDLPGIGLTKFRAEGTICRSGGTSDRSRPSAHWR